jgi:hypothetical protein
LDVNGGTMLFHIFVVWRCCSCQINES